MTSTPARASRKPSIIPAGPPPAMQHWATRLSLFLSFDSDMNLIRARAGNTFKWAGEWHQILLHLTIGVSHGDRAGAFTVCSLQEKHRLISGDCRMFGGVK